MEWREWVATNALRGLTKQALVDAMLAAGLESDPAIREVNFAMDHPYLKAAGALGIGANSAPPAADSSRADKFAWFLEVSRRNARQSSTFGEVPRVKKPSRQAFLDEFYAQNKPCIIEGALDDWAALTTWDGDYLKSRCGDRTVEVQANRNTDARYEINAKKLKKDMLFGDFVDSVESGVETNDFYITANNSGKNRAALEPLWADIGGLDYLDPDHEAGNGFFWYGPAGTVTPIHHDLTNNFMAQVRGRKRVKLIAPHDSAYVYNDRHCFSPVDIENPDLELYPKFAEATVIDVELAPGDLFFLPVGWWHGVRGLDISITMTFTNFVYENDFSSFYDSFGGISS